MLTNRLILLDIASHNQFFFVTTAYYVAIEFICNNIKENWEPGNMAKSMG